MARGINKVILVGNVGNDPEVRYMPSGDAVANFNVATNEAYKDKEGNLVEKTEWHRVAAFARLAEVIESYVKKGTLLYIEGSLHTRQYEDKDGVTKYATEIKAHTVQILNGGVTKEEGGERGGSQRGAQDRGGRQQERGGSRSASRDTGRGRSPRNDADDDDLPF